MASSDNDTMSPAERRAGLSLAAIFALRMLGLFLILPVFAVHAHGMPGGDNTALVGMAIGAYGLTQAFLQIPFGAASDRFGRKPVIVVGLLVKRFPMLIAGYNTMPPAKKKNVDIGGLSSFMRRHLVIMGALWILFTVVLELTDQTDTLAVIYVIYLLPYVVWMLVRAQRYDHN